MCNTLEQLEKLADFDIAFDKQLADNRIIMYKCAEINTDNAMDLIEQFILMDIQSNKPIFLVINSYGGDLSASLAIYDCIKALKSKVYIICMGIVASGGTVIASAGEKVYCLRNTEFLVHPMFIATQGVYGSVQNHSMHLAKMNEIYLNTLSKKTGKIVDDLITIVRDDMWMTADEAQEFGLVDIIVDKFTDIIV